MSTQIPDKTQITQKEADYVLGTYKRAPFVFEHGQGMYLYDTEGKAYLDFSSGIAVNALGHSDPQLVAAIQEQVAQLSHVCNLYHSAPQAELAASLCELSFADKVYFCNSGAEAIEAAIKFARKYALITHGPGKTGIVSFTGGFHGRTMGALAITPRVKYQESFKPLMPGASYAPFNDIDAAIEAITEETCGVFVEPVQGEGGINVAESAFLKALRTRCNEVGALLIFDEIQSGLGRTGKLWAYEHAGVQPDMMTLAKALGGGLPIGATLMTEQVANIMQPGDHGSTFAAGPIACRAAQVVLERVSSPEMLARVQSMSDLIVTSLSTLESSHIKAVRVAGLMIGIELDIEAASLIEAGYEQGIILLNAGPNVLRLLPPLIVTESDIEKLMSVLHEIIPA